MINSIQQFFKDPSKVTKLTVVAFFVAVLLSTYFLFRLKGDLVYYGGMIDSGRATGVLARLFVTIGLSFAFCYLAIHYVQRSKKEIIVYLDKKTEDALNRQDSGTSGSTESINLNALREVIQNAKSSDAKWQEGLSLLCRQLNCGQGALYLVHDTQGAKSIDLQSSFALVLGEGEKNPSFQWGEGLIGQVAASGKSLYLDELPEGYATRIESGLGNSLPKFIFILPIKKESASIGVVEIALFTDLSMTERNQAEQACTIFSEIS